MLVHCPFFATITYVGDEVEKNIYHGGSIFLFNIYQQSGDIEYEGFKTLALKKTTLIRKEPLKEYFYGIKELELKEGIYKFEAIANFSLDSEYVLETRVDIPVSKFHEVKYNY